MNNEANENKEKKVATRRVVTSSRENRLLYNPNNRNNNLIAQNYNANNDLEDIADEEEDETEEETQEETEEDNEEKSLENEEEKEEKKDTSQKKPTNIKKEVASDVAGKLLVNFGKKKIYFILICAGAVFLFFLLLLAMLGGSSSNNYNSYCGGENGDVISFIDTWEGESMADTCSDTEYRGYDIHDGTISIGAGMTNYAISTLEMAHYIEENNWQSYFNKQGSLYRVDVGLCVPKEIINKMKLHVIETTFGAHVDDVAIRLGLVLTQFQKDAIISFSYNVGNAYTEKVLTAYQNYGYAGLWDEMKTHTCAFGSCNQPGLMKRRKAEFALFVTGDYGDTVGNFYNRSLDNYDDYDSEHVMAQRMVCSHSSSFGELFAPLDEFYCSEGYHWRSVHPVTGGSSQHYGLDLGVGGVAGKPVYAVQSGTVIYVYKDANCSIYNNSNCKAPSCGNQVTIMHGDGTQTVYCHMQYQSVTVDVNDSVEGGQIIGKVGSTGSSTGPHLHFGLKLANGEWTDPYDYFKDTWVAFHENGILTGDLSRCE